MHKNITDFRTNVIVEYLTNIICMILVKCKKILEQFAEKYVCSIVITYG